MKELSVPIKANLILLSIFFTVAFIVLTGFYWLVQSGEITRYDESYACDENAQKKVEFRVGESLFYCRVGEVLKIPSRVISQSLVRVDTPIEMVYIRMPQLAGALTKLGHFTQCYRVLELPRFLPVGAYEWRVQIGYTLNILRVGEVEVAAPIKFKVIK